MILMSGSCHRHFLFLCIELDNKSKWPNVGAGSNNEECDYYTYAIWNRGNTTCDNNSEKMSVMEPTLTLKQLL